MKIKILTVIVLAFILGYNSFSQEYLSTFSYSIESKKNLETRKDESTLREVIATLSSLTGKQVSKAKEDKIIDTILKDKVPKSVDKMF